MTDPTKTELAPTKPWWQSRTQISVLVSSLAIVMAWAGVEIDTSGLTELILLAGALVANAGALWGRAVASEKLDKTRLIPGVHLPGASAGPLDD